MRVEVDRLVIEADEAGRIIGAAARSLPERSFVTTIDLGACRMDGVDVQWGPREVVLDPDEIGIGVGSGSLEVQLRHGFSVGWTTRLLIVNPGPAPRVVERLQLVARASVRHQVSGLAAGSRLCWAVQPDDGDGPLLAARLAAGAISRLTAEGFELGVLRLAPGQRYVTQLHWGLFATPRSVVAGPGREVLMARTAYEVGEAALLPEDPDAALVLPPGVGSDVIEDAEVGGREVYADAPARHRIELRSADGDISLDLSWVHTLPEQLAEWAAGVLSGPRTTAGVVVVEHLSAAIVLQAALGVGGLDDADQAADALDRVTAHLLHRADADGGSEEGAHADAGAVGRIGRADPFEVLYLLGEHGRSGDDDVLDLALTRLATLLADEGPVPPGLGLAVLRTVLAGAEAPERVVSVLHRAVDRTLNLTDAVSEETLVVGRAAGLELLLAVRPLLPDDHPTDQQLITRVRRLGAALGAGLPGRLLTPPPVTDHAHLVTVLRLLPEDGVPGVTRTWGATPSLLAHRLTLEVLDRLADTEEVGPAAAWLALGHT